MTRWTRRQSFPDTPDDFTISKDGREVGRVYYSSPQASSGRDPWFWSVIVLPTASGWAATRDEALEPVRAWVG